MTGTRAKAASARNGLMLTNTMSEVGYTESEPMKIKITVDKAKQMVTKIEFLDASGETEYYGAELIHGTAVATPDRKSVV